jgi:membrane protein DedA with SNARE-associated domain
MEGWSHYGYLGVFLTLIAAGCGLPIPEELPVLTAGVMVGHEDSRLKWYIMLPVVIAGVVLGDTVLYGMGRIWGRQLLEIGFVRRRFPRDKQEKLEKNFAERGISVLLGARLLPGIRAPVFIFAGVLKVPVARFMLADAIYAIPLVSIMFWSAYILTDQVLEIFNQLNAYRPLVISHLMAGIVGALVYKYVFSRPVSTGEAPHVPNIIAKPAVAAAHAVEKVMERAVETVTGRHHEKPHGEQSQHDGAAEQEFGIRTQEPSANGTVEKTEKEKTEGERGAPAT